ncbi:MAG: hypothetical protein ACOY3O_00305 [Thermodesulfobacteriota bacterium]
MREIISSLANKYGLSVAETMGEIESLFSAMLSKWYRTPVLVFFREDLRLEVVAYSDTGGVNMQRSADIAALKGKNTLLRYLEEGLARSGVLKETRRYKRFERDLRWGEIIGRDRDENLLIETEVVPGEPVIATCPMNRIGVHERKGSAFQTGQRRAFHLRRIEPVTVNGTPRLKVVVDRVSKTLVEKLLREELGASAAECSIRCLKRYVGHKSMVVTRRRLPRKAIIAVSRELKERVQVLVTKD